MFLKHFGLREQPFGVTPDPRFLYLSAAHREAMASLYYGIEANRGFLGLIAKPGMGKTTLLFHLLEKFRSSARTVFLFQTQCNSREFMRFLLAEMGYDDDGQDFVRLHEEFNKRLVQEARAGNRFIVVIDEAQNLDASVLETVRLLSDFETPRAKLMQIILAGQPELAAKLASPGLSQLRQRISSINGLEPLSVSEIKNYIEHRLRIAGYEGPSLFADDVIEEIGRFTEGIPRNINNFCFNALSLACAMQKTMVDSGVVREVIADLDISKHLSVPMAQSHAPRVPFIETAPVQALPVQDVPPQVLPPQNEVVPPAEGPKPSVASEDAVADERTLTPAQAKAYMQELAAKLKSWQESLDQVASRFPTPSGGSRPN